MMKGEWVRGEWVKRDSIRSVTPSPIHPITPSFLITRTHRPPQLLRQRAPFARVRIFDQHDVIRMPADDHALAGVHLLARLSVADQHRAFVDALAENADDTFGADHYGAERKTVRAERRDAHRLHVWTDDRPAGADVVR